MTSEQDNALMTQYGITSREKMIYFYKQFRYENLSDAVRFAKMDGERFHDNKSPRILPKKQV
jgi:transposase